MTAGLGLSQAAVARVTGISPPMLSQLARGHRIKIGNPQAAARFSAMLRLVEEVEAGLAHAEVAGRLEQIAHDDAASSTALTATAAVGRGDVPEAVSGVLRAVASGRELEAAATLLERDHRELAALLRAYGTGSPAEARAHYSGIAHLVT